MSDPCFHCREFSRSRLFHRAAAEAGKGLPNIEPGMPVPAGTGLNRRTFLTRAAGMALVVYGANGVRPEVFEEGIAEAAAQDPNARVLVSVFLEGGADPLHVLAPALDPNYRRLRARIGLPPTAGTPHSTNPALRWHPSAQALATLDKEGKVGVLPGIGYSQPDGSHFTSRHYWEIGSLLEGVGSGWLGRYLDLTGSPTNPMQGLSLDYVLQPALAPERAPVAAVSLPELYRLNTNVAVQERALDAVVAMGNAHGRARNAFGEAARVGANAAALHRQVHSDGGLPTPPVAYPQTGEPFPRRLATLAAFLGDGVPIRISALKAIGNFDTHAAQKSFDADMKLTFDSLLAFQRDLEARGLADRVLIHVWSEFGRRPTDNASLGTDHGAAGIGFVIGTNARKGQLSEYPPLDRFNERGNLLATVDFRGVYGALLEQWLQTDPTDVIPQAGDFARPALVR